MTPALRQRFDDLLHDVIDELPEHTRAAMEELSIIVDDAPEKKLADELARDLDLTPEGEESGDVMGLHTGQPITERGTGDTGSLPTVIHLFRESIVEHALEFRGSVDPLPEGTPKPTWRDWGNLPTDDEEVYEEIRITLLHEIGHHFGLDEDDLDRLGYA
ncbi:MAG: metallopeptidase family protein [Phycisphaerales bacterium]